MVAVVWLVTVPFDRGAYAAGFLFRKLTVVHQRLTPLWKFRTSDNLPDTCAGHTSWSRTTRASSSERLDARVSVMIFPEGTRSKTGELREFKSGAFRLAIEHRVPILPLAVYGTRDALRKHDWRLGDAEAEVRVLEPVSTEGLTMDDMPALRTQVRDLISAARDDLRSDFDD